MKLRYATTVLVTLLAVAICSSAYCQRPYRPQVGQQHPDFTLPNTADGKPVSLSDYRGKKVLLIHFASW